MASGCGFGEGDVRGSEGCEGGLASGGALGRGDGGRMASSGGGDGGGGGGGGLTGY